MVLRGGLGQHGHVVEDWALGAPTPGLSFFAVNEAYIKPADYLLGNHKEAWLAAPCGRGSGTDAVPASPLTPPPRKVGAAAGGLGLGSCA